MKTQRKMNVQAKPTPIPVNMLSHRRASAFSCAMKNQDLTTQLAVAINFGLRFENVSGNVAKKPAMLESSSPHAASCGCAGCAGGELQRKKSSQPGTAALGGTRLNI